jgi:hypothetical protein
MACANGQIVSAVLAPNGEPSQLYASLLKAVKGDQDKALNMFLMTKTIEFKEWFGDSKMVDANGEPLVVYHGSMGDAIENNQFKDDTLFFAEDEESYKGGGTTSVIEPVFIKAERLITPSIPLLGYMPNSTEKMDDVSNPAWYKSLKIVDAVGGIEHKSMHCLIKRMLNLYLIKASLVILLISMMNFQRMNN